MLPKRRSSACLDLITIVLLAAACVGAQFAAGTDLVEVYATVTDTDIHMLEGVAKGGGLAISFNGNQYSAPKANIAVSSMSLMALKPLADATDVWDFIRQWGTVKNKFKILPLVTSMYFKRSRIPLPFYDEVNKAKLPEIIKRQKEMRAAIRKEYATLT